MPGLFYLYGRHACSPPNATGSLSENSPLKGSANQENIARVIQKKLLHRELSAKLERRVSVYSRDLNRQFSRDGFLPSGPREDMLSPPRVDFNRLTLGFAKAEPAFQNEGKNLTRGFEGG